MIISFLYKGTRFIHFVLVHDNRCRWYISALKESPSLPIVLTCFWTWLYAHSPHNCKIPKKYDLVWDYSISVYIHVIFTSIHSWSAPLTGKHCVMCGRGGGGIIMLFLKSYRYCNKSFFSAFLRCISGEKYSNREYGVTTARLSEYISAHPARFPWKGSVPSQVCPKNHPQGDKPRPLVPAVAIFLSLIFSIILWHDGRQNRNEWP